MATTPKLGIYYPAATDAPNGPGQMQQLATSVESAAVLSYALFGAASNQTLPNGATTNLSLTSAAVPSSVVSRGAAGAGSVFTLNRKGLWLIHLFCRVQGGGTAAYTGLNLIPSPTSHPTVTAAETTNGITVLSITTPVLAEIGDTVTPAIYHERGTSTTISTLASMTGIRLAWLGVL